MALPAPPPAAGRGAVPWCKAHHDSMIPLLHACSVALQRGCTSTPAMVPPPLPPRRGCPACPGAVGGAVCRAVQGRRRQRRRRALRAGAGRQPQRRLSGSLRPRGQSGQRACWHSRSGGQGWRLCGCSVWIRSRLGNISSKWWPKHGHIFYIAEFNKKMWSQAMCCTAPGSSAYWPFLHVPTLPASFLFTFEVTWVPFLVMAAPTLAVTWAHKQ